MDAQSRDLLNSIYSDETAWFRTPEEPAPGDEVEVRLRLAKGARVRVTLLLGVPVRRVTMERARSDRLFDWYAARFACPDVRELTYSFLIEGEGHRIHFLKTGAREIDDLRSPDPTRSFRLLPGFHVPGWARGALQYQIFPDRFANGNPSNDVRNHEYYYAGGCARHAERWDELPGETDYRCFHGGDLQGILDHLDYLKRLGVEVLYLNPIFVSPSSHGYDTQDYRHVDPHLAVIPHDGGRVLAAGDTDNRAAGRYRKRTVDERNLAASDAFFADFCRRLHDNGMRVILDGVFNHCGAFHPWMNREGIYAADGAFGHPEDPRRSYFSFRENGEYESWWDIRTLPKLNYEMSEPLCEEIFEIAEKWVSPPYCADGWRLDVAADLGHGPAFNRWFWREFRARVRRANPEALIIAEHYGDPSDWLHGDAWDSVMNYDAFMEPVSWFLTGMEKHSDYRRDDLYQNGRALAEGLLEAMARLPGPSLLCAMNELSNHDHSRFLTRTNRVAGRLDSKGSAAAGEGVDIRVFREAVVMQMTLPGAPTIYYGDEAGLVGWTDPDNRRAYPWGHEDLELIELHSDLARLRASVPALRVGGFKPLLADWGAFAYARFDAESLAVILVNNADAPRRFDLDLRDAGVSSASGLRCAYATANVKKPFVLPPRCAAIYVPRGGRARREASEPE